MTAATADPKRVIGPQAGPQMMFAQTSADIAIYGGAAGGGKSWALLMEALRHVNVPGFTAVLFRRTYPMLTNPGGLWQQSMSFYPDIGAASVESKLEHRFPSGAVIKMSHLQHEKDKHGHQGAQYALIGFDELTHFSKGQFMYMLSRNRSTCGVKPYIRATCNPDSASWVRKFIAWWIDDATGVPIDERSGSVRWMVLDGDAIIWSDTRQEALEHCAPGVEPKSVTFIAAKVTDNVELMRADPGYVSTLHALPLFERSQLLKGNWNVRPIAGMFFQRSWFEVVDVPPADIRWIRYWDRAATEATERTNPDWTAGVKMGRTLEGIYYISHVDRFRARPEKVRQRIKHCALQDGKRCEVYLEQDPGQAGIADVHTLASFLDGFIVKFNRVHQSKVERWLPFSAQCEAGNVKIVAGQWNEDLFVELESACDEDQLPDELKPSEPIKKDQVDAAAGAYNMLCQAGAAGPGIG